MRKIISVTTVTLLLLSSWAFAQRQAVNSVKYMVTFDAGSSVYTAWLVPNYSTPNFNNPDTEEKGATAQFSLKVPKGFEIGSFQNLKGDWDKNASKIGSESYFKEAGLNTGLEYYIIGKTPSETNYGTFEAGEPVALFTFKGSAMNPNDVQVLDNDDEFVDISYNKLSLNVASSFYSRSGQTPKADAMPLEQFKTKTSLKEVVEKLAEKNGITEAMLYEEADASKSVLLYPNPSDSIVNIKYFSMQDEGNAKIELYDQNGSVLQSKDELAKRGFNTTQLDIQNLNGGTYLLRTTVGNNTITKKVIKIN